MSHRRNHDWEGDLAGSIIMVALVIAVVVFTLIVILITELWRVYKTRALQSTESSRIFWIVLACLLGAWLIAGLMTLNPQTLPLGVYVAAWSFLAFVIIVEILDARLSRTEQPAVPADLTLADVASWHPIGPASPSLPAVSQQPISASVRNGKPVTVEV